MTLARYVDFAVKGDELGWLVALESGRNVPFPIKRAYYIFGTKNGVRRGKHAHRRLTQMMVCLAGQCKVLLDDGKVREDIILARNDRGLMLEPMIWHEMYDFSPDCMLLVLADDGYNEADYLRNYDDFKAACA
ncbi:MAG: FdtA/QdtA family cupin domain-containing protein [Burkholderiales bacterium]